MKTKDKSRYLVIVVFVIIFLMRLYKISNPPLDYSSWRQTDTDSIARNFADYNFNIFCPQLNYDGPMPNYVQLEFQVTTFIIAIFYRIFGYSPIIGRSIPIAFFMGSCCYLYFLVKRKSGVKIAALSVLFYGILPLNVLYSRNIMPESSLMFFTLGALYYFMEWIDKGRLKYYILSIIFSSLAVATKVPSILICLPMMYLAVRKYGVSIFRMPHAYIFTVAVLFLPYVYFMWLGSISEQSFVNGIGFGMVIPNFPSAIFNTDNLSYVLGQLRDKILTIPGVILLFIGVFIHKQSGEKYYYVWLAAAFLHVVIIDAVIHLDYYMVFITPVVSIFMGFTASRLLQKKKYYYFFYIAAISILINDGIYMNSLLKPQNQYTTIGDHVISCTLREDLIIIGRDSPEILYTSGRKGWRLYDSLLIPENIEKLRSEGAVYFVPADVCLDSGIKKYLDENYEKICFSDGYYIYKLTRDCK